jgi:hypothetical protein
MNATHQQIPFWEKFTLSIDEATKYFGIGEHKLRRIIADHPNADFVLFNGRNIQIKRPLFEKFLEETNAI